MMLLKVGEGIIGHRSPLRQHPFRGKGAGPHRLQLCVCVEGRNQACVSPGATPLHQSARDRAGACDIWSRNGGALEYRAGACHRVGTGRRIVRGVHRRTPPSGVLWTFQAIETPVES
jgi:hypothetical protein